MIEIRRVACAAALASLMASAAQAEVPLAIGERVSALRFTDIHYLPRSLDDLGAKKAIVLFFTSADCPVARRYLPRVADLEARYRERGVAFVGVNAGAGDSIVETAEQSVEQDIAFPFVKDFGGEAARALGVDRLAEAVVLDGERRLRYRGRVDAQYRLSGVAAEPGRADLAEAIEDVLAGRDVRIAETLVDGCLVAFPPPREPARDVTFARDVAPLLQRHCQDCHRAGGSAPFPLVTHDDAVSHAPMIAEVVKEERMPPWFASAKHGTFENRRGLSADERRTIVDWVATGAPLGDANALPPPRRFSESRWTIGEPDLVVRMAEPVSIPATGIVDYKYVMLPFVFLQDTWVRAIQILPDNPRVMHHCNLAWFRVGEKFDENRNFITGQVPGGGPMALDAGVACRIPKGAMLGLEIHYVTTGEPETDRVSVGLVFPREVVHKEIQHLMLTNGRFEIPPGAPAWPVRASRAFDGDATGVGLFSHMHVRGRDMTFTAHSPDGRDETLLSIPNYSFDWQLAYVWPRGTQHFTKGTRVDCVAHYDNSQWNPFNPDPTKPVRFGRQTFEEMMYGYLFYTTDAEDLSLRVNPKNGWAQSHN
ncbi:MAG: redoxin domain-containing protein [Planctomycetes bacterium]|nr:redoxin domain-containing protein [Planctomycetota bacterium]